MYEWAAIAAVVEVHRWLMQTTFKVKVANDATHANCTYIVVIVGQSTLVGKS